MNMLFMPTISLMPSGVVAARTAETYAIVRRCLATIEDPHRTEPTSLNGMSSWWVLA